MFLKTIYRFKGLREQKYCNIRGLVDDFVQKKKKKHDFTRICCFYWRDTNSTQMGHFWAETELRTYFVHRSTRLFKQGEDTILFILRWINLLQTRSRLRGDEDDAEAVIKLFQFQNLHYLRPLHFRLRHRHTHHQCRNHHHRNQSCQYYHWLQVCSSPWCNTPP